MALPLLAIGEAVTAGLLGHKGSSHTKGLLADVSFGSQLQQKLDQIGTGSSDLLSQLAGMLQTGTPLATIIDRLAKELSGALAKATGTGGNTDRRRVLERALASALAPPGTSPPNQSGIQQAAALENRLKNLLSKISGELNKAGQQNRFPGAVLDAKSARETPAPQQKTTAVAAAPSGVLPSAESVLQRVIAQLQAAAPDNAPRNAPQTQPTQQIAPQTAPQQPADILARMLARAANADAQRSGSAPTPVSAAAVPGASAHATAPSGQVDSPSQFFARLMHVIAQAANENASHDGGKQSQEFAFAKNVLPIIHHAPSGAASTSAPAFSAALSNVTATAVQSSAPAAAPPAIDPQSVIEQVVKGIVLRNFGSTSEMRMRLQPEHLGDVSLKLTVTGSTISANIVAQNADVRDMLMNNQQQLARTLSEAGLSLGNFSVDVSGGNPGFSQQQSAQHRSLAKAGALHLGALGEDEDTWADPRFGPPLLGGSKSWVLNYLA